jgi:hypothetical protein
MARADGILDRLVYNAHRIEMRGDSMRKNRGSRTYSDVPFRLRNRPERERQHYPTRRDKWDSASCFAGPAS